MRDLIRGDRFTNSEKEELETVTDAGQRTFPEWDGSGHQYQAGDVVTYQGRAYKCVQAHPSSSDWTPVTVPTLWGALQ